MAESEMSKSSPIIRRTLHDELLSRIRSLIIDGELTPGKKVPERALCELFGVSRTPLREALKVLAAEGLVELAPNRGAVVATLHLADLEEGFPVMAMLEALSGELACKSITDEEIANIRALHERMREQHRARNLQEYFTLNRQIHEAILAAARNALLASHYHQVCHRVRRARLAANYSMEQWDKAMAEHEQIMTLLEARSGKELAAVLHDHIMGLLRFYRAHLAANEEQTARQTGS